MDFSNLKDIKTNFEAAGGEFISPLSVFADKLPAIKAFVFDWDGVFNSGFKQDNAGSPFSEPSSMGLNMLRFSSYLKSGEIPSIFIITGENNLPALKLAQREHFAAVYLSVRNKLNALEHIKTEFSIDASEVAFAFDDILDLGMAGRSALRFQVNRMANPLMDQFIKDNGLVDYKTGVGGEEHAVREICELIIGLSGNYDQTISERMNFSSMYQSYLKERNSSNPLFYNGKTGKIDHYNNS
jgi:3-deoxy-D-manno-octulosonate 8-phosphate phosphatase (KDO 8-P phosphatase)